MMHKVANALAIMREPAKYIKENTLYVGETGGLNNSNHRKEFT